jgi:acetolactate synthase-1/2/3 large subunit
MSSPSIPEHDEEVGRGTLAGAELVGHGGLIAAATLQAWGVDTLFTLSGGHLFSLYDGCVQRKLRLIDVRHEQTATFAAEGWAKVTRRLGVAALTAGPGVTNGISAITSAFFNGSPLLVLGGRAPAARWGQGSLQELDHPPIVASVTKLARTCGAPERIAEAIDEAVRSALAPQRGPTFVDFPLDVLFGQATAQVPEAVAGPAGPAVAVPDPDTIRDAGRLLAEAQRPVVMAGADVYWGRAEEALRRFAEAHDVAVFANGLGRGCLAADHPKAFSRARSKAFQQADLVIVVGAPLDFRLGFGRFGAGARVLHVMETSARLASHVELAVGVAGDLSLALDGISEAALAVGPRACGDWLQDLRVEEDAKRVAERELLQSSRDPIHPGRIYGELARRLDRDAIVIGDGGDFVSYAGKLVDTFTPGCFLDPGPFGCLGTGPGYAMAAKLAHPRRQVVLLVGDGAAGFSLGDVDTLARFGLEVVVVMGNNGCWGLEKHPMQQLFGYHVAAELSREARYDRVFEALGGGGERVERPEAVGAALDRALDHRGGPYLVEVLTDPEDAYPRSSNLA